MPLRPRSRTTFALDAALSLKGKDSHDDDETSTCHDQSGLLIVRGEPARIAVVQSILARMRDDTLARRKAEANKAERDSVRARRAAAAESRVMLQRAELDTARRRPERIAQLRDQARPPKTPSKSAAERRICRGRDGAG